MENVKNVLLWFMQNINYFQNNRLKKELTEIEKILATSNQTFSEQKGYFS